MIDDHEPDLAWMNWNAVMRKVVSLTRNNNLTAALSEIEAFLSREENAELRNEALAFRADLKEQLGDIEAAKKDLLTARSLVGPTYGRYVGELSLGAICEKQQRLDEAVSWYRTALRTCIEGEGISSGTALKKLLGLRREKGLVAEDQVLCAQAVQKSWEVLGLPGQPDLTNLPSVVSAIKDGESHPPRKGDSRP